MINVDNKKTITNLAAKSFRANKTRNVIAVIAIALTTILFTSIFTMGIGTVESLQQATMRQAGGDGHAVLKYMTQAQFDAVKDHSAIKEIAFDMALILSIMVGIFISKIFVPMLPYPKYRSIAYA